MKIIGYKTIVRSSQGILDQEVREEIKGGWQPFGNQIGFQFCNDQGEFAWSEFSQVLVKYEDVK